MTIDHELEAKFYLQNLPAVRSRLLALDAECIFERILETNLRYDTPDLAMTKDHELLRLRQDFATRLTFKSPARIVEGVSQRQEIEIKVSDFATAQRLLNALGYQVTAIYEKYREAYQLNGLFVTLDEMPFGDFIEIEGEDVSTIQQGSELLGLNWETNITCNYLSLFDRIQEAFPGRFTQVTFEEFQDAKIKPEDFGVAPADR